MVFFICSSASVVEKRPKKNEGGLLSGWSNKLAKQRLGVISGTLFSLFFQCIQDTKPSFKARNNLSREAVENQVDSLEFAGGEFDVDEPVESVRAARDVKKSGISVRGKVSSFKFIHHDATISVFLLDR